MYLGEEKRKYSGVFTKALKHDTRYSIKPIIHNSESRIATQSELHNDTLFGAFKDDILRRRWGRFHQRRTGNDKLDGGRQHDILREETVLILSMVVQATIILMVGKGMMCIGSPQADVIEEPTTENTVNLIA